MAAWQGLYLLVQALHGQQTGLRLLGALLRALCGGQSFAVQGIEGALTSEEACAGLAGTCKRCGMPGSPVQSQ